MGANNIMAKLLVRRSATNFFVSALDLFGKSLNTCTSGSSLQEGAGDRKRRLSVFAMQDIIINFTSTFFQYTIKKIIVVLRIRKSFIMYAVRKYLKVMQIKVLGILREFVNPHNGIRLKRNKRR